jgi:MbtH protein
MAAACSMGEREAALNWKGRRPTMSAIEQNDAAVYKVVVNHEQQYSIWPFHRPNPLGWEDAGKSGTKTDCLEFIKEVWTDMRPLSLRRKMEQVS